MYKIRVRVSLESHLPPTHTAIFIASLTFYKHGEPRVQNKQACRTSSSHL